MDFGINLNSGTTEPKFDLPTDFRFDHIRITTDRTDRIFEVQNVTSEFVIFEHIDKPFLTAKLVIVDIDPQVNLVDQIHFLGTEKVEVKIRTQSSEDFTITKNFVVTEVVISEKSGDGNEVIILDLIEDVAYHSALMRLSKSYTDNKLMIIGKLCQVVEREVFITPGVEEKINGDKQTKVIIPNMHPLEAANWIKDRTYTSDGFPFFFYSCISDDRLRLRDLRECLEEPALNNSQIPYSNSISFAQSNRGDGNPSEPNLLDEAFNITKVKVANIERHLELARMGFTTSKYNFVDTTTGNNITFDYDMSKQYEKLIEKQVLNGSRQTFYPTYDFNFRTGKELKNIREHSTKEITHFATSRQFNDFADTESYHEGKVLEDHTQKVIAKSLRHWLLKSSIQIEVPGKNFLRKDANLTIGNIIKCEFLSNRNLRRGLNSDDISDLKKSGEYMIYTARHQFTGNTYYVTMDIGRLGTKGYGIN
tara:strand:- start:401 stop:1834 length:1434 start_codon:yes stop_codon:yes gene_type:complete